MSPLKIVAIPYNRVQTFFVFRRGGFSPRPLTVMILRRISRTLGSTHGGFCTQGEDASAEKVRFLVSRISRNGRIPQQSWDELCKLSDSLTIRDCIKLTAIRSKQGGNLKSCEQTSILLRDRMSALLHRSPEQLELAILSLSRVPVAGESIILHICEATMSQPDGEATLRSLSPKELVNILNILSSKPRLRVTKLAEVIASISMGVLPRCDHRSGSLLVASIARMPLRFHTPLSQTLAAWCESQKPLMHEWTPQSVSLFVYSVSKLSRRPAVVPFIELLIARGDLGGFTNQNVCNLAVGLDQLGVKNEDTVFSDLSLRDLQRNDLLFLLKAKERRMCDFVIERLRNIGPISLEDLVVVCDVAPIHCQSEAVAAVVTANLERFQTDSDESEKLLYVLSRVNMPVAGLKFAIPKSGRKAADMLMSLFKLGLGDGTTERALAASVIADPTASNSDVAKTVLSLVSMPHPVNHPVADQLRELTSRLTSGLNDIDKRQLARAAAVAKTLSLPIDDSIVDVWETVSVGAARETRPASSRTHKAVLKSLDPARVESEHYVAQISSYVDILVTS